jgi:hypothetical protein
VTRRAHRGGIDTASSRIALDDGTRFWSLTRSVFGVAYCSALCQLAFRFSKLKASVQRRFAKHGARAVSAAAIVSSLARERRSCPSSGVAARGLQKGTRSERPW